MARTTDRKRTAATASGAALAAVMFAAPGLAAPAPVQQAGQVPSTESVAVDAKHGGKWTKPPMKLGAEYKHKGEYAVAGIGDGHIVFEDERGKLFYVDEATGDQKFVSRHMYAKIEIQRTGNLGHPIKLSGKVRILGIDQGGRTIMSNKRGEKFYLDPATGDMIFVK